MIKPFKPQYYIYFKDESNMKGFMIFTEKNEMNLWILLHGKSCKYMHIVAGYTLDERRVSNG